MLLLLPLPQLPQLAEGSYMTARVAHMPAHAIKTDNTSISRQVIYVHTLALARCAMQLQL
jgi:hypothetical protein